jgi:putative Mn2+ efflux pump MntP
MALLFGFFQGAMPVLGWLAGISFRSAIERWDHWIALIILSGLGLKMIYEGFSEKEEKPSGTDQSWKTLILLAIATSIDALATGIMFVSFSEIFLQAVVIIATVCFVFSFSGNFIGHFLGKKINFRVEILGGIVLIFIGIKIFAEHALFG